MRLWHYKILPYLPDSQLIAQWRELNAIYRNQPKHILINYVYKHDKKYLRSYSLLVLTEMTKRHFKISQQSQDNYMKYFSDVEFDNDYVDYPEHNDRYLMQCFRNLQEKYDRGQSDFTDELYSKLVNFIANEAVQSV